MPDRSKGEFNFNMFEGKNSNLQYQGRHHEDSEAVHKLHYEIKTVKKLTYGQKKMNDRLNLLTSKAVASHLDIHGLGVLRDYT
jgi:hypothetical protein